MFTMESFTTLMVRLLNELPLSEFNKACEQAGIDEETKADLLELLDEAAGEGL